MDAEHPSLDTLTGYDPDEDDPLLASANRTIHALDDVIERLQKRSDPPPTLPPSAPAVPRAA